MSSLVPVVFFSFYSRLSSLLEIVLVNLEMVLYTLVQYYTLIFGRLTLVRERPMKSLSSVCLSVRLHFHASISFLNIG